MPEQELPPALIERYRPVERTVYAAGREFRLLAVADTNALLDEIEPAAFADDERLPYWADLWTSGLALADYCLRLPSIRGMSILELGCGLGLAGIAAASAGARVVLTDYEPDALAFTRCNVERNLPGALADGRVTVDLLDWRSTGRGPRFDRILGADIAYERRNFLPLLRTLDLLLDASGTAVFTDPGRAIGADFAVLAELRGFRVNAVREAAPHHDAARTIVRYELWREP
jgi:predicted nicotinamide N-methyase